MEFNSVLRLDPDNLVAHYNLGMTLIQKGDYAGAITQYRKLISLVPDDAEAYYNLGLALKQKDALNDAVAELRKSDRP